MSPAKPPADKQNPIRAALEEWKHLSVGEWIFLALIAVLLIVFFALEPKGPEQVIPAALVIGLLAGAGIAVIRKRRGDRG